MNKNIWIVKTNSKPEEGDTKPLTPKVSLAESLPPQISLAKLLPPQISFAKALPSNISLVKPSTDISY